jgi:hypothetical protein
MAISHRDGHAMRVVARRFARPMGWDRNTQSDPADAIMALPAAGKNTGQKNPEMHSPRRA